MTTQQSSPLSGAVQFVPTVERILYGVGVVDTHLAAEVERLRGQHVLLLTPRSLERNPVAERVRAGLGLRLAESFTASFEHVPLERVAEATVAARRCAADLVVALGGGSVIDAGKALRTCLAAGITTAQELGSFMERLAPPTGTFIPQVSIPTTLSGAEYTRSFSVTDFARRIKRSYTDSTVASRVILYDPTVTVETPTQLWLTSGVMAIDHAVEVVCASPQHLVGNALKLASLRYLLPSLPRTQQMPDDLEARLQCQVGAWLADHSPLRAQPLMPTATALPSHALAYELGAVCRVPYGLTACVTLPACLRWSAARMPQAGARQAELARTLGIVSSHHPDAEAAHSLAEALQALITQLGLPTQLRDVAVSHEDIERIARQFARRGASLTGAGPVSEADVVALLESTW
ncbi:MAG TPA: iron-containing alcohol dehydrogenase [Candidatus Binatia bacterium]|jgi:alcohol dehydrogenase class IV|nr:iron-containing alcohol dehydrogenase [Candidatus Binatia bacterium]